tara:strand:+ start:9466 stop:10323 length:858 start_codon:yes stop_codon:yes gene_type:complete
MSEEILNEWYANNIFPYDYYVASTTENNMIGDDFEDPLAQDLFELGFAAATGGGFGAAKYLGSALGSDLMKGGGGTTLPFIGDSIRTGEWDKRKLNERLREEQFKKNIPKRDEWFYADGFRKEYPQMAELSKEKQIKIFERFFDKHHIALNRNFYYPHATKAKELGLQDLEKEWNLGNLRNKPERPTPIPQGKPREEPASGWFCYDEDKYTKGYCENRRIGAIVDNVKQTHTYEEDQKKKIEENKKKNTLPDGTDIWASSGKPVSDGGGRASFFWEEKDWYKKKR